MSTCLRCGYCCRVATCPYGTWNAARHACTHLTGQEGQFACGIYDSIMARPEAERWVAPAFGAGCCSPLNGDRMLLLRRQSGKL